MDNVTLFVVSVPLVLCAGLVVAGLVLASRNRTDIPKYTLTDQEQRTLRATLAQLRQDALACRQAGKLAKAQAYTDQADKLARSECYKAQATERAALEELRASAEAAKEAGKHKVAAKLKAKADKWETRLDNDTGFLVGLAIGSATGSTFFGTAISGNLAGAWLGAGSHESRRSSFFDSDGGSWSGTRSGWSAGSGWRDSDDNSFGGFSGHCFDSDSSSSCSAFSD